MSFLRCSVPSPTWCHTEGKEAAKDTGIPTVVWVGDTGSAYHWKSWCGEYLKRIQMARTKRKAPALPLSWPIYIVDFTDSVKRQRCKNVERVMGKEYVNYSQRSLATRRHWDVDKKCVDVGFRIPFLHEGALY